MAKPLIIVESPTKGKTISRFLSGKYEVEASFGHVRDLPKSKMGIDTENSFAPSYVVPNKAKETIKNLKQKAKNAPEIILATDEDREGEAISWHLVQALGLGDEESILKGAEDGRIKRIVFHEITKPAIEHALSNPRKIDLNLVNAQQARRILDRLVGYELSPFLWRKIRYGLSAGRVQSVAVRLIVEREREIQAFKQEEYWSIEAEFGKLNEKSVFSAKLFKVADKTLGKMGLRTETDARGIVTELSNAKYKVIEVNKKEVKRNPSPPFTTSTLQQEAARKFGMSAKQTMVIAQQLYEGINLPGEGGSTGLITYMRTDSLNLAQSALKQAQEVIRRDFGENYVLSEPRYFSNKSKGAQEAHEAIRPTDLSRHPESIKDFLDKGQLKIYDLIWKRTVASQMQTAILDQTSVDISAEGTNLSQSYVFRANGQVVKFDGFIRAYTEGVDEKNEDEIEGALPKLENDESLKLESLKPLQHFTEPPPRYTDASLIKSLESHGVGRPSTYAPTLSTIQDRGYAEKIDKKYKPSEEGMVVTDMLVENFPEIVDINFTSHIEESFDAIAEGKMAWVPVLEEFYGPFKKHLIEKENTVEKKVSESNTPCPHCGKNMIIKFGRMGQFLACPEPESKITMPMPEEAAKIAELTEKTKDEVCPLCGKHMDVKRGRFGYFLGCIDYPKCKGISKIWNKLGLKCPNCMEKKLSPVGDIVEKKGRGRGKPFFACTRWPECDFISNTKPENEAHLAELFKAFKATPKDKPKKTRQKKS